MIETAHKGGLHLTEVSASVEAEYQSETTKKLNTPLHSASETAISKPPSGGMSCVVKVKGHF